MLVHKRIVSVIFFLIQAEVVCMAIFQFIDRKPRLTPAVCARLHISNRLSWLVVSAVCPVSVKKQFNERGFFFKEELLQPSDD